MSSIILVFCGGALGASLRYLTSELISSSAITVLISNLVGTAIAGYFALSRRYPSVEIRNKNGKFWVTGFAGGLTTFSSLSFFLIELEIWKASLFAALTIFGSLLILILLGREPGPLDEESRA